jgi:hypothetical protein
MISYPSANLTNIVRSLPDIASNRSQLGRNLLESSSQVSSLKLALGIHHRIWLNVRKQAVHESRILRHHGLRLQNVRYLRRRILAESFKFDPNHFKHLT